MAKNGNLQICRSLPFAPDTLPQKVPSILLDQGVLLGHAMYIRMSIIYFSKYDWSTRNQGFAWIMILIDMLFLYVYYIIDQEIAHGRPITTSKLYRSTHPKKNVTEAKVLHYLRTYDAYIKV
jgi:hypothetical protein